MHSAYARRHLGYLLDPIRLLIVNSSLGFSCVAVADAVPPLPHISVVQALQHQNGVAVERGSGFDSRLNVLGFDDAYTTTELNGFRHYSVTGESGADLHLYSAQLFGASLNTAGDAEGLAGEVSLSSGGALAEDESGIFALLGAGSAELAAELPRAEDSAQQWAILGQALLAEGRVRLSGGVESTTLPYAQQRYESGAYVEQVQLIENPQRDYFLPESLEFSAQMGDAKRDSLVLTGHWDVTPQLFIEATMFQSELEQSVMSSGLNVSYLDWADFIADPEIANEVYITGGQFFSGSSGATRLGFVSDDLSNREDLSSLGLRFGGDVGSMTFHLGYHTQSLDTVDTRYAATAYAHTVVTDSEGQPIESPLVRRSDLNLALRNSENEVPELAYTYSADQSSVFALASVDHTPVERTLEADEIFASLAWKFDFGPAKALRADLRHLSQDYRRTERIFRYGVMENDGPLQLTPADTATGSWSGDFVHLPGYLAIDANSIVARAAAREDVVYDNLNSRPIEPRQLWRLDPSQPGYYDSSSTILDSGSGEREKLQLSVRGDFEFDLGVVKNRSYLSLSYADIEQNVPFIYEAVGNPDVSRVTIIDEVGTSNSDYARSVVTADYSKVLPSFSASFELLQNIVLSLGQAHKIQDVSMDLLVGSPRVGVNAQNPFEPVFEYSSAYNPRLKPMEARLNWVELDWLIEGFATRIHVQHQRTKLQNLLSEDFRIGVPVEFFEALGFVVPSEVEIIVGGVPASVALASTGNYYSLEQSGGSENLNTTSVMVNQGLVLIHEVLSPMSLNLSYTAYDADQFYVDDLLQLVMQWQSEKLYGALKFSALGGGESGEGFWAVQRQDEQFLDVEFAISPLANLWLSLTAHNITDESAASTWQEVGVTQSYSSIGRSFMLSAAYRY